MRQVGPYRLLSEVARGGMGAVYRAWDPGLEREVAIKLLHLGRDVTGAARIRFQREAEALARLRHPHVVPIHAAGESEGTPYLVLELIPGRSLQARLDQEGPLPPREAATLIWKLAGAVAHAHAQGLLHRDLKPGNVLIDSSGEPRLTDFGLALAVDSDSLSRLSRSGMFLGSPGYWPPEQGRGELHALGPRSDVYGLGATLYALLTGVPPHRGETLPELLMSLGEPPQPPSALRSGVPRELDAICLRCLQNEPSARYPDAAALAGDLAAWLAGRPLAGAAAGGGGRRTLLGAAALLALGGAAALGLRALPRSATAPGPAPGPAASPSVAPSPGPGPEHPGWPLSLRWTGASLTTDARLPVRFDLPWATSLGPGGGVRFQAGGALCPELLQVVTLPPPPWQLEARVVIAALEPGTRVVLRLEDDPSGAGNDHVELLLAGGLETTGPQARGTIMWRAGNSLGGRGNPGGGRALGPGEELRLVLGAEEGAPGLRARILSASGLPLLDEQLDATSPLSGEVLLRFGANLGKSADRSPFFSHGNGETFARLDLELLALELRSATLAPTQAPPAEEDLGAAAARLLLLGQLPALDELLANQSQTLLSGTRGPVSSIWDLVYLRTFARAELDTPGNVAEALLGLQSALRVDGEDRLRRRWAQDLPLLSERFRDALAEGLTAWSERRDAAGLLRWAAERAAADPGGEPPRETLARWGDVALACRAARRRGGDPDPALEGRAWLRLGDLEAARALLEQAAPTPRVRGDLLLALARLGELEQARALAAAGPVELDAFGPWDAAWVLPWLRGGLSAPAPPGPAGSGAGSR